MNIVSEAYEYCTRTEPEEGVEYPLTVQYCGECSMPIEYCEFSHCQEKCKMWLEKTLPDLFEKLNAEGQVGDSEAKKKSRQSRGGKGIALKKTTEPKVKLSRSSRGKNKYVTTVTGLETCGVDLKVASKYFGSKFACGSSCTASKGEIIIQGDVKDDLFDIISEKWPEVLEAYIEDLGDIKR